MERKPVKWIYTKITVKKTENSEMAIKPIFSTFSRIFTIIAKKMLKSQNFRKTFLKKSQKF